MKIRIAYIGLLSIVLTACSTPKVMKEPTVLAPLDSHYALDKRWQVKMETMPNLDSEGLFFSEDADNLYVAGATGHIVALKKLATTRWQDQVVWESKFSSPIVSGPAKHGDQLIIGSAKGQLMSLAANSGQLEWQVQLSSEVMSHATIAEGKVFTRTVDGKLYAVDVATGEIIWVVEHQMPNLSLRGAPAVLYNEGNLFVGWESGVIQALSAQSGALLWEARIAVPKGRTDLERMIDVQASLVIQHDRLFALGFHGKLVAIDPQNGNFYFVKEVSGYSDFVIDGSTIYVVDDTDVLHAFDLVNGANLWKQEALKNRLVGDLNFYKDELLVSDSWGYLHWIDKLQGIETARVKHSNDYGDGNRILRVKVDNENVTLLDGEGTITRYEVKPSNLVLFKAEHGDLSLLDKLINFFK
ncbi:MAG: outer membrane protein assembly factor BamB [Thiomicrorhabdus sp.]|nr:MAG: outer membrane protein assembly factor BamB [Thiomicrorhabdus sp.]